MAFKGQGRTEVETEGKERDRTVVETDQEPGITKFREQGAVAITKFQEITVEVTKHQEITVETTKFQEMGTEEVPTEVKGQEIMDMETDLVQHKV